MREHSRPPAWAVLCDMDGTLLDTERTWLTVVDAVIRELCGEPHASLVIATEGLTLLQTASVLRERLSLDQSEDAIVELLDRRALDEYSRGIALLPGARQLLRALKDAQVRAALVTSSPRHWVDQFARSVDLSALQIMITADDVSGPKPAPDPYLLAANELGVAPGRCVAIEDSLVGARSALSAGCHTLIVGAHAHAAPVGAIPVKALTELSVEDLCAIAQRSGSSKLDA